MNGAPEAEKAGSALQKLEPTELGSALAPEIVEVLRGASGGQININILLQQVTEKEDSPDRALEHADALITLSERYEEHRLKTFKARTEAIIKAKVDDPDEIEKRSNNFVRRCLKIVMAGCAITCLLGALVSVLAGGSIVVTGLLAVIGGVSIAMLE